ncbi:hypothetical protein Scep_025772 [Stephania cephalantha]|uniref:Uncharacterized protein n=1 Tax=Stephania cephalantha TaxID=152367 RepID=A0AAP0HML3_9MAGN
MEVGSGSKDCEIEISSPQSACSSPDQVSPNNVQFGNFWSQNVSIKLDKTNFLILQAIIVSFVEGQDLDGFLFGTFACPCNLLVDGTANSEFKKWYILNRKLSSWLVNTLSPVVAAQVISPHYHNASFELWITIQNYCAINKKSQIQVLKKNSQHKEGRDVYDKVIDKDEGVSGWYVHYRGSYG